MSDTSVIHLHPKTRNFTQVENDTIRDNRLSFRATGLLVYLLSLPHGSHIASEKLVGRKKEKRDSIRTAYNELVQFGYVHRERKQHEDGRWTTIIHVYEVPTPENQASGFQSSENRASVSQAITPKGGKTEKQDAEIGSSFPCLSLACNESFPTMAERDTHYDHCFASPGDLPADAIEVNR